MSTTNLIRPHDSTRPSILFFFFRKLVLFVRVILHFSVLKLSYILTPLFNLHLYLKSNHAKIILICLSGILNLFHHLPFRRDCFFYSSLVCPILLHRRYLFKLNYCSHWAAGAALNWS